MDRWTLVEVRQNLKRIDKARDAVQLAPLDYEDYKTVRSIIDSRREMYIRDLQAHYDAGWE